MMQRIAEMLIFRLAIVGAFAGLCIVSLNLARWAGDRFGLSQGAEIAVWLILWIPPFKAAAMYLIYRALGFHSAGEAPRG